MQCIAELLLLLILHAFHHRSQMQLSRLNIQTSNFCSSVGRSFVRPFVRPSTVTVLPSANLYIFPLAWNGSLEVRGGRGGKGGDGVEAAVRRQLR